MKIIKQIAALLSVLILILSMSACSGKAPKYYTDENGTKYLIVRDENGSIITSDTNKLKVYELNENGKKQKSDSGEYITKYIDFIGQVVEGQNAETKEMSFTLPAYFDEEKTAPGYFHYDAVGGEIFITYYNAERDPMEQMLKSKEFACENLLESYGSEYFSYEKYSEMICGIECVSFMMKCTSPEYNKTDYFFYIPYDSGYYEINCRVNTDKAKKVNFSKFIKSVELK